MPTGPLRSDTPALPVKSIRRLYHTMRTKSMPLYQVYFSRRPKVASWTATPR